MASNNMSIANNLRDIRTYHGYTQKELAMYLNIDPSNYTDYETYRRIIPLKHLNKLSEFYNLSIDYILALTTTNNETTNIELNKEIIGANIKNIRKSLNLTLIEFAQKINKSKSIISDYEKGLKMITTATLYDIAKTFNISVDWIIGKSNQKHLK